MAVMSRSCKLVTHRLFTSEERIRHLTYESAHKSVQLVPMLWVQLHHTAKQFRVFEITSNKVHFATNFSRKKYRRFSDRLQ